MNASLKDHEIAVLVNDLRDIAVEFEGAQQLRERIAQRVRAAIASAALSSLSAERSAVLMDGKPATAEGILYALVDIDHDAQYSPPEHRCYIPSAFNDTMELARRFLATPSAAVRAGPPPELTWLYTHCRAIGMTCKSDSGKWEHDIALFTINLKEQVSSLEKAAAIDAAILQRVLPECYAVIDGLVADAKDKALATRARRLLPKGYANSFTPADPK